MAHFFEKLGNKIKSLFTKRKGKGEEISKRYSEEEIIKNEQISGSGYEKYLERNNCKDPEESSVLLEDEKKNMYLVNTAKVSENKRVNSILLIQTKRVPILYGVLSLTTVIFMVVYSYLNHSELDLFSDFGPNHLKVLDFFKIYKVHSFIFHLLNTSTSFVGICLIFCIYFTINSKMTGMINDAKLYLAILFGLSSHFFQFSYGIGVFVNGFEKLNETFQTEIYISLIQFIFFLQIFFTVLFGIFIILLMISAKSNSTAALETPEGNLQEYKWLDYKLLAIIYLIFFTLAYIFIQLHSSHVILSKFTNAVLVVNYSYLLVILPYSLFLINTIFYTLFYDELKHQELKITQPNEKTFYDESQKNIL
jgi:hypothetical protein